MRGAKADMALRGSEIVFRHLAENVHASLTRLLERLAHDLGRDAGNLDIHLQGGDAARRPRHLEIHVAVMVLRPGDVREDGVAAGLFVHDQAHRDAGHRRLQGDAGVHHGHGPSAHGRHRRGPVRFEDVRHDADRVSELVLAGNDGREGAFGERAMADLAAARTAQKRHLADRERREVVVQHEPLVELAADVLDLLLVVRGAERAGDERLCFAAREDDRSVRPGKDAGLAPDRPDLVELAAVEPVSALEHFVAQHLLLELVEDLLGFDAALDLAFGNRRDELFEQLIDAVVVLELAANPHRLAERHVDFLFDLAVEVVADFLLLDGELLLADARARAHRCRRRSA